MRAVQVTRFGGPEVLDVSDVPEPVPGPGQKLIDVTVADVLSLDAQLRSGWGREWFGQAPPYIPGTGVAGLHEGLPVVAMVDGGYADRAVAAVVIPVPEALEPVQAAALLQAGPAALALVEAAALTEGDRVLITAAAGGLGTLLVQLAAASGAHVVAVAGGDGKRALALDLGAARALGYADELPEVDVVFDGVGGAVGEAAFARTRRRFFAYGVASGSPAPVQGDRVTGMEQVQFSPERHAELTSRVLALAARGGLRPVIGLTEPLHRAAAAHEAIESRSVLGKTLLVI
ncbi:zinc-binding dehydrogenase [Nonomuraea sp. NPDC050663]|uniref:zinc-binding dehydrogenase n=1 Tax=Nonomuraea sp. NPDC050663 TaxID=3364370 RepID=UPI00379227D8